MYSDVLQTLYSIIVLHVHVIYIVVFISLTSLCFHKLQTCYCCCCCNVCSARWCFSPRAPTERPLPPICGCNHLIHRLWSHKTVSRDLRHKDSSWWGMTFTTEPGRTPWLTCLWHNSTSRLRVWLEPSALLNSALPCMPCCFCSPHAKNQIRFKAA